MKTFLTFLLSLLVLGSGYAADSSKTVILNDVLTTTLADFTNNLTVLTVGTLNVPGTFNVGNITVGTFEATNTVYLIYQITPLSQLTNIVVDFAQSDEQAFNVPSGGLRIVHATNLPGAGTNMYKTITLVNTNTAVPKGVMISNMGNLGTFNGWITNDLTFSARVIFSNGVAHVRYGIAGY